MGEKDFLFISLSKIIEQENTLIKLEEKEYGITRDTEKIAKLSRKQFLTLSLSSHSRNVEILTKAHNQILANNTNLFQNTNLPASHLGRHSSNESNWLNSNCSQNPYAPEHLIYKCNNGIMVRSKSERIIANKLLEYVIVFKYEAPIEIDGVLYYPDFTILKRNGDIVLWEHNGLMSNEEYLIKALQKIRKYKKKGFVQHKNLICTEEEDVRDESTLDEIIYKFILS